MDYTIKELPQSERPREKLEENGSSSLTDVELLSLILRTGTSGKNVKELSAEILNSYTLSSLAERSLEDLKGFEGVSRVKAGQLKAVGELSLRMQNEEKDPIESFSDAKSRLQDMKFLEEEKLRILLLNSGNELLKEEEIEGGVDSVNLKTRTVFSKALKENAAAVILAHNHPSGSSEPTEEDIKTTEDLINLGDQLGVSMLDHIIVGNKAVSMRKETELSF